MKIAKRPRFIRATSWFTLDRYSERWKRRIGNGWRPLPLSSPDFMLILRGR